MKLREITTPLVLHEGAAWDKVSKYYNTLLKTTYWAFAAKPVYDYWANMEAAKKQISDPKKLEQRHQLELGYLITELTAAIGSTLGSKVGIFMLSELFNFIPIIGPLFGKLFRALAPIAQVKFMSWLTSDDGRLAIAKLLTVDVVEDIPGYGEGIWETIKAGLKWAWDEVKKEAGEMLPGQKTDTEKPATTDPLPAGDTTPPADDPWNPKPKEPTKKPTEFKNIVAPTDDSAYTSLDRVVRGPNGKLQLK